MKRLAHEANPGGGCRMCNSFIDLEVHHRTYVRCPYNEQLADLTVVCNECHTVYENARKAKVQAKLASIWPPPPMVPVSARLQQLLDQMLPPRKD